MIARASFGVEVLHQFGRPFDIREQGRNGLAFALEDGDRINFGGHARKFDQKLISIEGVAAPVDALRSAAHSPQTFAVVTFSNPQLRQRFFNGAAHSVCRIYQPFWIFQLHNLSNAF